MDLALANKVVLITGASKGIGKQIAQGFYDEGCTIHIVSRSMKNLEAAALEIAGQEQAQIHLHAEDISSKGVAGRLLDVTGIPDILINNAGVAHNLALVEEIDSEMLNSVVRDNLLPTFNMMKYTIPIMKKNNSGTIINISSRAGRRAVPKLSAYTAAKFAVRGLTESVAKEVENNNIRCISISPGGVNTEMRRKLFGDEDAGNQQPTSRIINIITKILSEQIQVPNGADVLIVKDKEPIIKVPES